MSTYKKQVGGEHYKKYKIQPAEFIMQNNIPWSEGEAIVHIIRHKDKAGKEDLEKAKHYIDMIIEKNYSNNPEPKKTTQADWLKGYNKWKKQGVVSDKVKLKDLQKLLNK